MVDIQTGVNDIAKRQVRRMALFYVLLKQAMLMFSPNVDSVSWIFPRVLASAVIYGLVYLVTRTQTSNYRLAALVPIALAAPEILWVGFAHGGEWLIYVFIIGCSLLGLLFLDVKGLAVSMLANASFLAFCSFVLGCNISGAKHAWGDVLGFTAVLFVNFMLYSLCKQFTRAFTQFRETGEAFATFMETTPGYLAVINDRARIKHISQSFANWFGISDSEYAKDRAFLDLCRKSGLMPAIQGIMERGGMSEETHEVIRNGESRHFMLRSFPMGGGGVARTFEFTDVTDMVEAMIAAEESEKQKTSFLANMSHEIRTPMNAIVGMTELMLTTKMSEEQMSQAVAIKNAASSLLTIINDILDFSKLDAEKMNIVAEPFDFAALINDTLGIINIKALAAGLSLTAVVSKDIPPMINGDEVRLKQCLLNLLNNSVKFTRDGAVSLQVSCERVEKGVKLNFTVKDTGVGMKVSEMGGLFESFSRLDTKKNHDVSGTGLGLAITKKLIEMMGGRISVESVYGVGSAFSFYVVCEGPHEGRLADLPEPREYRVLAFEPDRYHAESLRFMFEELDVKYDICQKFDDFEKKLGGEYSHVLYDKSAAKLFEGDLTPKPNHAVMKGVQDAPDANVHSLNRPLLVTGLVKFLGGAVAAGDSQGLRDEIRLGAFKTKNCRALLVDDSLVNLSVAEGMLRKYDIDVVTAVNGKEGVDRLKREEFDIAFFDQMMPVMDGVEAVRAIRALGGRFAETPIVALTANAVSGVREMFLKNGFNDYLSKPIAIAELHAALERWIPKEKQTPVETFGEEEIRADMDIIASIAIDGVDFELGISRTGGTASGYLRALAVFCADARNKAAEIKRAMTVGDLSAYTIHIHALKSASANIGARGLSESAKALEDAGRRGDWPFIKENTGSALADLEAVLRGADPVVAAKKEKRANARELRADVDRGALKAALANMKNALEELDPGAIGSADKELARFEDAEEVGEQVEKILRNVLNGDYDEAVKLIDVLILNL